MAMLYGKHDHETNKFLTPIFGDPAEQHDLPKYRLAQHALAPREADRLVRDELLDEGNSRLNLATFCQTYMEPEAVDLMKDTLAKNAIDKSEYPRTAEIENRCVNIIANLWHAPESEKFTGTSTIGSSEACMLGGLAMKFAWRKRAQKAGLDLNAQRPNLVISAGYQVCWEKFCVYWDIDMHVVPMDEHQMALDTAHVLDYVDDYTIGIIGIMGITYTGQYDDLSTLDAIVDKYNHHHTELPVYIHVDAASGGFYAPFVDSQLIWDFQLKNVISINASGHKYGLVYPGVGWIIWRDQQFLPEELVFKVSYLGGELPTMAINFSHSAAQLIGQYYNFVRFGWDGYREIQTKTHNVARYLAKAIEQLGEFSLINNGQQLPLICYQLVPRSDREWTLYDLSDRLLMNGWQVPTYPLPANLEQQVIQRIVVRADFGMNMAHDFIDDLTAAIKALNQAHIVYHADEAPKKYGFTH
ncbi:glutamate decarboxylase [Lactobacillus plantarum JDM1] [Lactiplantibacillus mudanjiangensis]|uniref:Glutamate decarboxylase n=2 Tax=Lactiplantibacillus mudanjiangensis TaxID=1296538 RepID=A0A660DYM9_9LACO|nr:glutamate decarboxylase [Lactobacillus plantarum JDM1] [Lactiplantibacillus mudanjiangensis]VDG23916.1 glutamate decarboxylase [Lactobacillus plantarum JDM1] [Lactiplantibacillus mudanjiangensis]VDG27089.1 glutamate decarboxylase [Lactobacillus plantarum JDM1] [Lactiplantibacillus mudanjiangensis]VDG34003.1 glutamate decarboxylase [Lactobacillus plantarum JDM1] [Lactiplantibacillus mudanjiangensis]